MSTTEAMVDIAPFVIIVAAVLLRVRWYSRRGRRNE